VKLSGTTATDVVAPPVESQGSGRPETVEHALSRHGFDWPRLEKLARSALNNRMAIRRIQLDAVRYEEALELYIEVGARWALEYDPDLAGGQSFATSCYRRMLPRLTDYLRRVHGDARRGNPIYVQTTASGELPEGSRMDEETFDQLVEQVRPRLKGWAADALDILRAVVVEGLPSVVIAERHGIEPSLVGEYLEGLGHQLRLRIGVA